MLIRKAGLVVGVALLATIGLSNAAAGAAPPPVECAKRDALTGVCLVVVSVPGEADGAGAGGGAVPVNNRAGGSGEASGGADNGADAPPEPCSHVVAEPQPPESHPVWAGQTPADGAIYLRVCPRPDGNGSGVRTELVFVASGTDPPAGPPIDPRVLAEQVIASMAMRGPQIRMAPPPGSTGGLVGLPVWMWTERGVNTLGPVEQSASAGGVTVVAVAQVSQIVWEMGDGTTVVCGPGTPYPAGATGQSPDCGHVYERASSQHVPGSGPWPITATSIWTVTWSGGGLSGTETLDLSSSAELLVGELHVLNQDGGRR